MKMEMETEESPQVDPSCYWFRGLGSWVWEKPVANKLGVENTNWKILF